MSDSNANLKQTKQSLMQLAVDRQARVEAMTIRQYALALAGFSDEIIRQVCEDMGRQAVEAYQPRFPTKESIASACRKLQGELTRTVRYFCADCASEDGFLFFDAPRNGNRLRGTDIVTAERRYARRCPCGGTETDWRTLDQERSYRQSVRSVTVERARAAGQ